MSCTVLASRDGPIAVPGLGVGCWSWGDDKGVWGWNNYDKQLTINSIAEAFNSSVDAGMRLFDTAETYGGGLSEEILGKLVREHSLATDLLVATKFQPGKWRNTPIRQAMLQAAKESLERLGIEQITLFQIHAPLHPSSFEEQGHGLADVVEAGLARAVGVSNFSLEEMMQVHKALKSRGIPLASNQVEFSILRSLPESTGLLAKCDELNIRLLAYSPLAMGRLSGKYSAKREPQGRRGFSAYPMKEIEPLLQELRKVAAKHECTPAQVALAWVLHKGAIPIPGAKNAVQAGENAAALHCKLTQEEVETLAKMGREGGTSNWQHA